MALEREFAPTYQPTDTRKVVSGHPTAICYHVYLQPETNYIINKLYTNSQSNEKVEYNYKCKIKYRTTPKKGLNLVLLLSLINQTRLITQKWIQLGGTLVTTILEYTNISSLFKIG